MKKKFLKKVDAFTLQELLVTMVIIGILAMIAIPLYNKVITSAKSKEAQLQLNFIHSLEKNYHLMHSKYTNDMNLLDFEAQKTIINGGTSRYSYEIVEFSSSSFKARATAVVDFDNDGVFNVWEIDHEQNLKEVVKD